jgi:hypothetical protein
VNQARFILLMVVFSGHQGALMFSKHLMSVWISCTLIFLICSGLLAKAGQKTPQKTGTITLTGCLQEGRMLNRFLLAGQSEKTYSLRSTSVKLTEHVGQKVNIKGQLTRDPKRDEFDFEGSEANEEYGKGKLTDPIDVDVKNLKVVSSSCN